MAPPFSSVANRYHSSASANTGHREVFHGGFARAFAAPKICLYAIARRYGPGKLEELEYADLAAMCWHASAAHLIAPGHLSINPDD